MRLQLKRPVNLIPSFSRTRSKREALGGILLILAMLLSLGWANSAWSESYHQFWQTELSIQIGRWAFTLSLLHWINDGLMAVFFFVIGLEIKRELVGGTLSARHHASLPVAAALGGMVVPVAIYLAFTLGSEGSRGWGIPMATDPIFMLGLLALMWQGLPNSLKILTFFALVSYFWKMNG